MRPEPFRFALVAACCGLVVGILAIYFRVSNFDFLVCDDDAYVTKNPRVLGGLSRDGIRWAFSDAHAGNYHPLTWMSHMTDVSVFGRPGEHFLGRKSAGAHHFVNVLLHASTAALVLVILRRMTGRFWPPVMVAYLFALHPLRVESVAWVAERKDVLSGFFWMLTLLAYSHYTRRVDGFRRSLRCGDRKSADNSPIDFGLTLGTYLLVVISFLLGLLSKSMLVTLPCVMLLLDIWPLARWRVTPRDKNDSTSESRPTVLGDLWIFIEKIPIIAIASVFCFKAVQGQTAAGAMNALAAVPMNGRIANALVAYVAYLGKTVCPIHLAIFYPHDVVLAGRVSSELIRDGAIAGVVLFLLSTVMLMLLRWRAFFAVGWFWYVGTLVPVIGLVQVGTQSMADRYTYIPSIGLFIMVVWLVTEGIDRWRRLRQPAAALSVVVLSVLSALTWSYVGKWKNSQTLFEHAARVTKNNYFAHNHIGLAHEAEQKHEEARQAFERAITIHPGYDFGHNNLAVYYARKGMRAKAEQHLKIAVQVNPQYVDALSNLGVLYEMQGKLDEGEHYLQKSLQLQADRPETHFNLGIIHQKREQWELAAQFFEQAIQHNPGMANVYAPLGNAYFHLGQLDEAEHYLQRGVRFDSSLAQPFHVLGLVHLEHMKLKEAVKCFEKAVRINPNHEHARRNLRRLRRQISAARNRQE